ncbi:MAG: type III-B CRISPR module RAMP protein Cmr4 [Thermocladium sp.]
MNQYEVRKLFLIEALTPMHPGLGKGSEGFVDLPVQRDELGFPTIWASSLKGAIKSSLLLSCNNKQNNIDRISCRRKLLLIFGPESNEASTYASAITLLDARLILIPARSLKGVWTYVTSPHLLNYLLTYLDAVNDNNKLSDLNNILSFIKNTIGKSAIVSKKDIMIEVDGKNRIVLNEQELPAEYNDKLALFFNHISPEIASIVNERGITVVNDDHINDIVRKSLMVQPRIKLDYASKTVTSGGLWMEEYLPQYTIMASVLICRRIKLANLNDNNLNDIIIKLAGNDARNDDKTKEELANIYKKFIEELNYADNVLNTVKSLSSMMFGGKETVGKGLAKLIWIGDRSAKT